MAEILPSYFSVNHYYSFIRQWDTLHLSESQFALSKHIHDMPNVFIVRNIRAESVRFRHDI